MGLPTRGVPSARAAPALRRAAPARRGRAGARRRALDPPSRRAVRRARPDHAPRASARVRAPPAGVDEDVAVRHARREGGARPRVTRRASLGRPDRGARIPAGVPRRAGRGGPDVSRRPRLEAGGCMTEGLAPEILDQTLAHAVLVLTRSPRVPRGHPGRRRAEPQESGAGVGAVVRERRADDPEPRALRIPDPAALRRRDRPAHGDRRARPLRAPPDPAQHAHGPPRRRCRPSWNPRSRWA